ncbi:hypothetical protein GCM10009122_24210 [Fulvivirga kasyanovii]|uniref:DUF4268 domain-containing protein n=1 Tax=Fulvivirga kasyanovii TaxID=396812 RepID=A0ABW9RYI6_9BACT|nr:DUF4268 domain-containing protein [Fulvivirga kasyanovii]MTI28085.1 DUF4268 domain-containing protein [Fulvivirga kasyanovii]
MKQTAYGKPLFLNDTDQVTHLNKIEVLDELSIQYLIFKNPECLPISDIDESYNPVIPVCTELNTTVGPLDILMVSPNGELTIIETKLWRNPEARRKVVAQILDYARELSNWTYEDLQREINRRLGKKGNTLYNLVKAFNPNSALPESDFVDSVSRNLERGRFLLLIAGDGIREGASGIAEFLSNAGHLNFTFAMVELTLYQAEGLGKLIVPKTLVKTTEISKMTVEIPVGFILTKDDDFEVTKATPVQSPEKERERNFYIRFWNELIAELSFDDPGQPIPKPAVAQNLYVYPGNTKKAWISAYFMKSQKRVGVYFRVQNDQEGNEILKALSEDRDSIRQELGNEVMWSWDDSGDVGVRLLCDDVFAEENREDIKEFFKTWLNTFVNVIRPRIKKISV